MDDMYCDAHAVDSLGVKYEYWIRIESNVGGGYDFRAGLIFCSRSHF